MRWRALLFCSLTQLVFAFSDHQKVINDNNELESIRKEYVYWFKSFLISQMANCFRLVNADIIPEGKQFRTSESMELSTLEK
jgi:hypothetical protein